MRPRIALPLLLCALLCVLLGALLSCSQPRTDLHVFSALSFEQALAQSRAQDKLLLVDVSASWCPPCQKMEQTTWREPKVAAWLGAHAIAVQVDADRDAAVAQQLGIENLPTLIVFQDGHELDRSVGYLDADKLLAWLAPPNER